MYLFFLRGKGALEGAVETSWEEVVVAVVSDSGGGRLVDYTKLVICPSSHLRKGPRNCFPRG